MDTIIKLLEEYAFPAGKTGLGRRARGIERLRRRIDKLAAQMLDEALREKHRDVVELLVAHGTDKYEGRRELPRLARAAFDWEEDAMRMLLEAGCEVDARNRDGDTPLMFAIFRGFEEGVRLLINAGADVNARGGKDGWPVIVTAACMNWGCWPAVMEMLLDAGADINATTPQGYTALRQAVHKGRPEMVRFLLEHGARADTVDARGQTPLEHAIARKEAEIVRLLQVQKVTPHSSILGTCSDFLASRGRNDRHKVGASHEA